MSKPVYTVMFCASVERFRHHVLSTLQTKYLSHASSSKCPRLNQCNKANSANGPLKTGVHAGVTAKCLRKMHNDDFLNM